MGRLRSFDPDSVLDRAMHAFWARGFEATSIEDLVACTGINRASLYGAFGDKRDLFLKALQLYVQTGPIIELDPSTRKGGVRAALQAYIDQVLDLMSDGRNRGCFITNTVAEFGSQDADILAQTRIALAGVENAFDRLLRWGQQTGEVPAQADAFGRDTGPAGYLESESGCPRPATDRRSGHRRRIGPRFLTSTLRQILIRQP